MVGAHLHVRHRANPNGRAAISHARNQILGAVRFLDWLATHKLTLTTCTQGDLDLWLATGGRSRYDVHHFVEWTSERKLSPTLKVPSLRSGPGDALDAETRWAIIAKLLRDPGVELADRVAGTFVLLYAQPLSRIAVMTIDAIAITTTDTDVSVRFGTRALAVPAPLATHVTELIATGRAHHIGIGSTAPSRGCFPDTYRGDPSPPTDSVNDSGCSASTREQHDGPLNSNSPPRFPQSSSPRCSASPSEPPSTGSTPPEALGQLRRHHRHRY